MSAHLGMKGDGTSVLVCSRCHGEETYLRPGESRPFYMLDAMTRAFTREHRACGQAAPPPAPADVQAWYQGHDTGLSSLTIWHVMMGLRPQRPSIPLDPSDFGRCHRLLAIAPQWRQRLGEVAEVYPEWRGLVDHWGDLEALYLEELPTGQAPRLYARMKDLLP